VTTLTATFHYVSAFLGKLLLDAKRCMPSGAYDVFSNF
jgi:hypothetical protein